MSALPIHMRLQLDGLDAANHEVDLDALGQLLQGMGQIASTAASFAITQKYIKRKASQTVYAVAKEPKANCFALDVIWNFVSQNQLFAGAAGTLLAALVPFIISNAANKREEMKLLKDSLDRAIHELGNRDQAVVLRLLNTVEKMAAELRPAVQKTVAPLGTSAKTLTVTIHDGLHSSSYKYNEADAAAINKTKNEEITKAKQLSVLITELDLERGTCKVHLDNTGKDKRYPATIVDPAALVNPYNPYAAAFAEHRPLRVIAKELLRDGEVVRLYISDLAHPD